MLVDVYFDTTVTVIANAGTEVNGDRMCNWNDYTILIHTTIFTTSTRATNIFGGSW